MIAMLQELRDRQLEQWPMACANYERLGETLRRSFDVGPLHGAFQYNPARIVSTSAKVDKESIGKRPCFLCAANRPSEQLSEEILPGWEFLINPFPIFPLHFTIAASTHRPQDEIPLEMASMAESLRGMTVFFNGARAGASAPDHLHCQAVATFELPLMRYLEEGGDPALLPFRVDYRVITPDLAGMAALNEISSVKGIDRLTGEADPRLVNAYFWIGADGLLRAAVVRRSAHRPSCYPVGGAVEAGSSKSLMVSPGAIDMAGVVVLPRREDFDAISDSDIRLIYSEVALAPVNSQTAVSDEGK